MRKLIALACLAFTCLTMGAFFTQAQARGHQARGQLGPRTSYVSFQPQVHSLGCLRPKARAMVASLTARIGAIEVTSTCGGRHARHSQHYRGNAIDFRPKHASVRQTLAVLRSMPQVGGIGSYSGGLIHADVGEARHAWHGHRRGVRYASRLSRRNRTG